MHLPSRAARAIRSGLLFLAAIAGSGAATAASWTYLEGPFGGQPLALLIDAAGNTWAGLNSSGVYSRAAGATRWTLRPGLPTQSNAQFAIGGTGTTYVSGSSGVYALPAGATTWTKVSGTDGLPGQAGSGMTSDAQGAVYVAMNNTGAIYKLAAGGATWTTVGAGLPADGMANNLVFDGAGNFWASLYGKGVYKLPAGGATWSAMNSGLASLSVQALAVVGNDLFAGNQFGGAYKLANASGGGATWAAWNGDSLTSTAAVYDFAVGAGNTLYAAGYGAVHALPSGATTWTAVGTGLGPHGPSYALVYSNADGALTLGNGSGIFVLPAGVTAWQRANEGMTASTINGMAFAPNGDLYAGTFGQGVQRLANGSAVWTAVDPSRTDPTIRAIVIDGLGTVYASSQGTVVKLSGGTWSTAGTGQGGGFSTSLAVDAANGVWSGQNGSVMRLAAGASAWVEMGSGLPDDTVNALAFDAAGNAYAGLDDSGVYVLAPGGQTWIPRNTNLGSLRVRALAPDGAGGMYAGTANGVLQLVAGVWQGVGMGLVAEVQALARDANGDLYAGIENTHAWRLPAGSTGPWTQVSRGLGSRSVMALAASGGRVYAGTSASRGSPSGVFVFVPQDSVVEFYNTNLDNYFITANPDEQAAIGNGSAGPGWTTTGDYFNAGGTSLVCRFYGSLTPGPNSHFYTIDPAECQSLKDLQASTPASEKRWNFESNDFASSAPVVGQCAAGSVPVYRAYNNGFTRGVDSNHRITANHAAYLAQVARGWAGEGVVMCAPSR
ncbi:MAG: hypothetical protein IPO58_09375 [Betaproteobacteria bacterium]|nr:hypothetical protein [Betaproteobacteria bacterium]